MNDTTSASSRNTLDVYDRRRFGSAQRMILTYLKGAGGECLRQRIEIARDIGHSSMTMALQRLEAIGAVHVWKRPIMRQVQYVTLTDQGREIATLIERGEI